MPIRVISTITLSVPGEPKGNPRPRVRVHKTKTGRTFAQAYNPHTADAWKNRIYLAALGKVREPFDGPVKVSADVFFPRPERLLKKNSPAGAIPHTVKPDRDNVDKSILDALSEAGLWVDDDRVYAGGVQKWYVAKGAIPGAVIRIEFHEFVEEGIWTPEQQNS